MKAASYKLWTTLEKIVDTVKKFSTFRPSRDLPNDEEESILLWVNKVGQILKCIIHSELYMCTYFSEAVLIIACYGYIKKSIKSKPAFS